MPELPEVETIRRHLAPHVEGRTLRTLAIDDSRWCQPLSPAELAAALEGRRVERLSRRGKYLTWELEDDVFLVMHLRMTGTLLLDPPAPPPHTRVRFGIGEHALAAAIKEVLAAGIDAGGSTIDDFRHPDGVSGAFQNDFLVHLRRDEPCVECGTTIVKMVAAGRGTYVCERCQPRPRARRRRPAAQAAARS